jgi:hypothetical protein
LEIALQAILNQMLIQPLVSNVPPLPAPDAFLPVPVLNNAVIVKIPIKKLMNFVYVKMAILIKMINALDAIHLVLPVLEQLKIIAPLVLKLLL